MTRLVLCRKYQQDLPAACASSSWRNWTDIFENISAKAWEEAEQPNDAINEHRLA